MIQVSFRSPVTNSLQLFARLHTSLRVAAHLTGVHCQPGEPPYSSVAGFHTGGGIEQGLGLWPPVDPLGPHLGDCRSASRTPPFLCVAGLPPRTSLDLRQHPRALNSINGVQI